MISLMSLILLNSYLDNPSKVLLLFFVFGFLGVCTIAAWKLPSWSLAQETGRNNKGDANDPGSLPLQFVFRDFASLFGRGPRFSDTLWQINHLPLSFLVPKLTVQTGITSVDFELGISNTKGSFQCQKALDTVNPKVKDLVKIWNARKTSPNPKMDCLCWNQAQSFDSKILHFTSRSTGKLKLSDFSQAENRDDTGKKITFPGKKLQALEKT